MKTKITFLLVSLLIVFTGNLIGQVNAGDNTTICSGDTLVLDDATAPNDYSILWTSSGTGTFNNNTLVNPTYYPVYLETVVTLTITATFHGESESDSLELTIQALPTVDAGSNATICEDDSFTVFDATADNESSVNWTGGNGSWQNSTTLTPTYTPNASEYGESVTLTIEALPIGPCIVSATDGMKIFVQAAPAVDAGDDRTTSINTPIPLTGEEQNTRSIEWSDNSAGGSFVPNNSITTTYTPPRDYTDPIEIFIKGLALEPCTGFDEDNMFLSIQEGPVAEVGSNVTTCEETAIPILGEASNFSSVHWTTSGAGTFSLPDSVETTYTPSELDTGDTIQLTLFAYPVFPFPDTASADMKLFVQPQLIGVSAGGNLSTCEETAKLITGTATNFSSVLWTTSGTGTFSQPDELETNYTPDLGETDFVTLTLTANAINECDSVISKSMTLFIQPQLTGVSAGGDLSTCEETAKLITGTATNFSSVLWTSSGTGTFRPSDSLETNYTPDLGETGFVTLTLMANAINECDSVISKSMILFIQPQ